MRIGGGFILVKFLSDIRILPLIQVGGTAYNFCSVNKNTLNSLTKTSDLKSHLTTP